MSNKDRVVTTNASKIIWPTDPWGFTRELRKAIVTSASRLNGDKAKKAVFDETVKVALDFVNAKYRKDAAERKAKVDAAIAADAASEDAQEDKPVKTAEDALFEDA